jgi:pimeloyl-ACP methyl ester carboxylesterase
MSISEELGAWRTVEVPAGRIGYRVRGSGRPIVFVHGVGVNGDLWRHVVPLLADSYCCIAPDLPFGAHAFALGQSVDVSLPGLARVVADLLAALELRDAVVVANDTGGAVAQALVGQWPERVGSLVLTSCDAFEKFPPTPQLYLKPAARSAALMWLVAWLTQFELVQRLPTAYGWTTFDPIDPGVMRSYTDPVRLDPGVRRDLRRLLRAVDTRYTYEAAEALRSFDKPALVVWAGNDKLFPWQHGQRLASLLPQGRFAVVERSRTFIPEEQPRRLAALVREFLGDPAAPGA